MVHINSQHKHTHTLTEWPLENDVPSHWFPLIFLPSSMQTGLAGTSQTVQRDIPYPVCPHPRMDTSYSRQPTCWPYSLPELITVISIIIYTQPQQKATPPFSSPSKSFLCGQVRHGALHHTWKNSNRALGEKKIPRAPSLNYRVPANPLDWNTGTP